MYRNLSTDEAIKLLKDDDSAGWSWGGAEALINYLEDLEDSLNKPIEFDRVLFRCEYSEYPNILEAAQDYGFNPENDDDEDEIEAAALAYLEYRTTVIKFEGALLFNSFNISYQLSVNTIF